jgi:hypothetical protein
MLPTEMAVRRLRNLRLFNVNKYLLNNSDVAQTGVDPCFHFLTHGRFERRRAFEIFYLAKCIGFAACQIANDPIAKRSSSQPKGIDRHGSPSVGIACSSRGNIFMKNIATHLGYELGSAGANVTQLNESDNPFANFDHLIIIAPHEFFYEHRGDKWLIKKALGSSVMLSTEQVQTKWFLDSLPYLLESKSIIDMYVHSTYLLRESGIPSLYYVPNPYPAVICFGSNYTAHPLFATMPRGARGVPNAETEFDHRCLDVNFFGTESPHRDQVLTRCAPVFAKYKCFIYYRRLSRGPLVNDDDSLVDLAAHVAGHSKVTLNLHRDYFGAFEWFRIVQLGMCSGSVVLSERGLPVPYFAPGTHYFEADGRHIPEMLEWILNDDDGRIQAKRVRTNAMRALAEAYKVNHAGRGVLEFLEENK